MHFLNKMRIELRTFSAIHHDNVAFNYCSRLITFSTMIIWSICPARIGASRIKVSSNLLISKILLTLIRDAPMIRDLNTSLKGPERTRNSEQFCQPRNSLEDSSGDCVRLLMCKAPLDQVVGQTTTPTTLAHHDQHYQSSYIQVHRIMF